MEKYAISIDWLEVYCKSIDNVCLDNPSYVAEHTHCEYILTKRESGTQIFNRLYTLAKKCDEQYIQVATIQSDPRLPTISRRGVCLKLTNRVLYCQEPIAELYHIVELLHLNIQGITRLDLCYDCNRFAGGRNPARFLKQYIAEDYDSARFIYKKGSNRFRLFGRKSSNSAYSINGLEFGSTKSNYRSYIYDKTAELSEIKDKPWIREMWSKNGLISNDEIHVFRSEISIKARGADLLNMSTGELFKLSPNYLQFQEQVEKLFHIYAAKALSFSIRRDAKKLRDFTPLTLFEASPEITCKPYNMSRYKDTGRAETLAASTINKVAQLYTNVSQYYSDTLRDAISFLNAVSGQKQKITQYRNAVEQCRAAQRNELCDALGIDYLAFCEALGRGYTELTTPVTNPQGDIVDTYTPAFFEQDSLALYIQWQDYLQDATHSPYPLERLDRTGYAGEAAETITKKFRKPQYITNVNVVADFEI